MVAPLIAAGGLLLARGAAALLPKIAKLGAKIISKPVKSIAITSAAFFAGGLLKESPMARVFITEAPKTTFQFGQKIAREIEEPKKKKEVTVAEGLKKAGILGAVAAGAVGLIKTIPKARAKEKVLEPADIIKQQPLEGITKDIKEPTLGAVEVPKAIPKEKPFTIRNTFNPTIDIRFSKSRKFINQQVLVN